jgi:serine/threonine protein kinase
MSNSSPVMVSDAFAGDPLEKATAHSSEGSSDVEYFMPAEMAERLVQQTELRVSQVLQRSSFLPRNCKLYELPRFEREDMDVGVMIAAGGFSNVHQVHSFKRENKLNTGNNIDRQYVLKHLNPKLASTPRKLVVGAKDLVMEAHFLASFNHKNIIQLRGWTSAGIAGFAETGRADGFFLVLDRLELTLSRQITMWRERSKEIKNGSLIKSRSAARMQLFAERLQTAIDVAAAVEYLHANNIIYRDLKPANVGFDQYGTLKVFDFGLAVELPEGSDRDSTFNLAGNTGTARYMAVEVIRKLPYNVKVDVFSFSILLWEIMALCKPYDGKPGPEVKERVGNFGERPAIPKTWPNILRQVLKRGWTEVIRERPHMDEVKNALLKLHQASTTPKTMFSKSASK